MTNHLTIFSILTSFDSDNNVTDEQMHTGIAHITLRIRRHLKKFATRLQTERELLQFNALAAPLCQTVHALIIQLFLPVLLARLPS